MADHNPLRTVRRLLRGIWPRTVQGLLIALLLVVLVPLLAVQAGVLYSVYQSRLATALRTNLELARTVSAAFGAFVRDVSNQELVVGEALAGPEPPVQVTRLLESSARAYPSIRDFSVLSPTGQVVASSDPSRVGLDLSDRPYVQAIIAGQDQVVSDVYESPTRGGLVFAIARGVRGVGGPPGELQNIVVAVVDPQRLGELALPVVRGGQGAASIFDRAGVLAFRAPEEPLTLEERTQAAERPLVARALAGEEVTGTYISPITGQERVAGLVPVTDIGWVASASLPLASVVAPLTSDVAVSAAVVVATAAAAFGLALTAGRQLTTPISRLEEHAEDVGRGNLTRRTEVRGPVELEALAAAFNRMAEEIRRRQEQREEYTRIISHDLRQPLTIIQAQAQLLLRALDREGRANGERRSADSILTSAKRMNAMIQDLVDTARLEAGQFRLNLQPVDLPAFVFDLVGRLAGVIETGRIRVQPSEGLPRVTADPDRLERILLNLLTNALKYSAPGTEVTVSFREEDGLVVTAIADRGPGIAPDVLPHLFERYYRAPEVRERREGLGLGLYITRLLVETHGGSIWAESEVGVGSTFSFSLPVARPRGSETEAADSS